MIERTVYVYTYEKPGSRPLVLTYLEYQTGHACVHVVTVDGWRAADGRRAKAAAEREHRRRCVPMGVWARPHDRHQSGSQCDCDRYMLPVEPRRRLPECTV